MEGCRRRTSLLTVGQGPVAKQDSSVAGERGQGQSVSFVEHKDVEKREKLDLGREKERNPSPSSASSALRKQGWA